jgi:predicted permease
MIRPPRLAAWLIDREVEDRRGEDLLGDLDELFQARVAECGGPAARRWYWRQAINIIIDAIRERRRQPPPPAGDSFMQTIGQDLRYALRSLRANPGFTSVAVLMLALGIGANATIFSWVNSVLLTPLPGTLRSHELVQLTYLYRGDVMPSFSFPDYRDITAGAKLVSGVAAYDDLGVGIVIDRDAERAWAQIVSANFFDVLGVPVVAGRTFMSDDDEPGRASVVLSHAYWQRRFGGDAAVIGRQITVNAQPFTIIGVAAPGFQGGVSGVAYDMWVPIGTQPLISGGGSRLAARGSRWLGLLARLAPGATADQARAELDAIITGMRDNYAAEGRYVDHRAGVFSLSNAPDGGVAVLRPVLLILSAVAAIVLLITCANLAGLLLARASTRRREIAIRLSMGAGRGRIMQQLLIEGGVLASLGAIGALIALRWTAGLLMGFAPPSELPIYLAVSIDNRVVAFTALLSMVTVALFALAPAAQATPTDVAGTLRSTGASGSTFTRNRLRRWLVVAQVAMSISLLVGAGLCIRSLREAARMTPGFQADGVIVGWLDPLSAGYTSATGRSYYERVLEQVRVMPGVESATLSRRIPLGFTGWSSSDITVEGHTTTPDDPRSVGINYVGSDYARTMQIPITSGRDIAASDVSGQPLVAVINETMAKRYWTDRDPIGGRFMFGQPRADQAPQWITVVGVSRDIKQRSLTERPSPSAVLPILQFYAPGAVLNVRTSRDLDAMTGNLQRAMRELDPRVPFYNVSQLADHTRAATFQQQLAGDLLVVFGMLALALAGIGSYGVLAYLVGMRRREISIRLAVGATRGDVFRLIAGSGARLIGSGVVVGLALSIGVGMGLKSLLIGVQPIDPVTYATVIGLLMTVAAAACLLPARRAAAVDPAIALREE